MSFIFKVETTEEIKSAQLYCLEGLLIEGQICQGNKAYLFVNNQPIEILIESVVYINRTRNAMTQNKLTLSINKPKCELKDLEGLMMTHDINNQHKIVVIQEEKSTKKSKRKSRM